MAFRAVLDACVLYPVTLRDTLLRLAAVELFDALWSERIWAEVERNLRGAGLSERQIAGLSDAVHRAFEEALVDGEQVAALEGSMVVEEKDRHVVAAAVAVGAEIVVTANLRDFEGSEANGVEAVHPDDFLCDLLDLNPRAVLDVLARQVAESRKPPTDIEGHLEFLSDKSGVPKFADRVRSLI